MKTNKNDNDCNCGKPLKKNEIKIKKNMKNFKKFNAL